MNQSQKIADLLAFDPIDAAEKLVGESWKGNTSDPRNINIDVAALGGVLAMEHGSRKKVVLLAADDTLFSDELGRYMSIIHDMGFKQVLSLPFQAMYDGEQITEFFFCFMHPQKGILLHFDTFGSTSVNSAQFLYCLEPKGDYRKVPSGVFSSGGWMSKGIGCIQRYDEMPTDLYYTGYTDAREALRHKIAMLEANGTFLSPWPDNNNQFMWLLHYMDTKEPNYNYKEITAQRIAMMPEWAQEILNIK